MQHRVSKHRIAHGVITGSLLVLMLVLTTGCGDTTYVSSVPNSNVHIDINTHTDWLYVHFRPEVMGDYTSIDKSGYHYCGQTLALKERDIYYIGYMGLMIVADGSKFTTYDLCCPHCISRSRNVAVIPEGVFATCPHCGEQYDCSCGVGNPLKGISKESLRRYPTAYSSGIIRIRN